VLPTPDGPSIPHLMQQEEDLTGTVPDPETGTDTAGTGRTTRPRVVYDARLQAECTLTYDDEGLLVTFGAIPPTSTGSWGVVVHALRSAVMEVDG
jgi:hypothetical protein